MYNYSPYQFAIARIFAGALTIAAGLRFGLLSDPASAIAPGIALAIAGVLVLSGVWRRGAALTILVCGAGIYALSPRPAILPDFVALAALLLAMILAPAGESLRWRPPPVFASRNRMPAAANAPDWVFPPALAVFTLLAASACAALLVWSRPVVGTSGEAGGPASGVEALRCFAWCAVDAIYFTGFNLAWILPPWPQTPGTATRQQEEPVGPAAGRQAIVFFDGVCSLCNHSVDFLVRADRARVLRYAPLQGETAAELLTPDAVNDMETMVFRDARGRLHTRSEAILRIGVQLGGLWRLGGIALLIPRALRDSLYKWVAKNRYRWFGKKDSCRMPAPHERELFLM